MVARDKELDLDFVDESLLSRAYPTSSFLQCGICSICQNTENMSKDEANGTFCQINPDYTFYRIVHCDTKKCVAIARSIFNIWLAEKNLFFISQDSATDLFPQKKVRIMRSNGSLDDATLDLSFPFVYQNEKVCVCCVLDENAKYKFVPLASIFQHNPDLKNCWQESKFQITYENQIKRFRHRFVQGIRKYVATL